MPDKNIVVLYHGPTCQDGFASALAAWLKFRDSADYIPMEYGKKPPDVKGKEVYILDFSFKREVLLEMHSVAKSIVVLDHHKTAQADLEGLDFAKFDTDQSGCALAWNYFHPTKWVLPPLIMHVQDRDLWRFIHPNTKAYCEGLRSIPMDFVSWESALHGNSIGLVNTGRVLLKAHMDYVTELAKHDHRIKLANSYGRAVNTNSKYASDLGNQLAEKSKTFGCTYFYDGASKLWCYSLRSIGDYDVSEIAKFYNGGGHKNAAGFSSTFQLGF
jgi:nanoRNase/pAp phosphatase (c-di-AMP/oligoRNAs hydrolase)